MLGRGPEPSVRGGRSRARRRWTGRRPRSDELRVGHQGPRAEWETTTTSDAPSAAPRRSSFAVAAAGTYATNVAVALLSLVNVLIVARALGAAGRGDVAFLITVATVTSYVGTLSVQEANANLAGANPPLRRSLATNSIVLALLLGTGAAAAVAGLVVVFPVVGGEPERYLLWAALASVPVVVLKIYLNFLVQADYAFGITNVAWLLGPTTTSIVNGLLAVTGALSVGRAISAWIVGQALGTGLLVVYVARHAGFGRPDASLARRALGFGAKAHMSRFMSVGNYRGDQWFLGAIRGSRELGVYNVAIAWAEVLHYLPGVLVMIQRPDLVRATQAQAARVAAQVLRVAILLSAFLTVGLLIAAPFLCVTVFGEEFRGSIHELRVLAFAAFGISMLDLLGGALISQRKPLRASAAVSVAFVATIALALLLIPPYGGVGAALTRTLAYTAGGAAAALVFARALGGRGTDLVPRGTEIPWFWNKVRSRLSRA